MQALWAHDREATLAVLGKDASSWISSGDIVADRAAVERFISAYDGRHELVTKDGKATLTLGADDFPFAFPIVRDGKRWRFDTATGKVEMLAHRIGENELNAIKVLQAIVDAQLDYAAADWNGDGSSPMRRNSSAAQARRTACIGRSSLDKHRARRANCWQGVQRRLPGRRRQADALPRR